MNTVDIVEFIYRHVIFDMIKNTITDTILLQRNAQCDYLSSSLSYENNSSMTEPCKR